MSNVRNVCGDCMKEVRKNFQKMDLKAIKIGDFVKLKIEDYNGTEYPWFIVVGFEDDFIIGELNNYPVLTKCLNFGELKRFRVSEIVQYDGNEEENK